MKKVLLVLLGLVVAAVLTVAIIGMAQADPQDVTVSARLKQPPEAVYAALIDFEKWPSWNEALKNARRGPDQNGHPVWMMDASFGTLTDEVKETTPPANGQPGRIVTQIADPKSPLQGSWTWTLTPVEGGTDVKL